MKSEREALTKSWNQKDFFPWKKTPSYTFGGRVSWGNHYGEQFRDYSEN